MSLQDPQEPFEREMEDSAEDEILEESPVSDSDASEEQESESVDVPENESEGMCLPANEELPPLGDESLPSDTPEGPAWYVIHCYSGYENKVRHNLE